MELVTISLKDTDVRTAMHWCNARNVGEYFHSIVTYDWQCILIFKVPRSVLSEVKKRMAM